ncbi:MAG: cation-translocating P-type ATPase, partial [Gaiellaceae bacterium]
MTKIQQLSVAAAVESVHGAEQGLPSSEAERRFREFGPNRVKEIPRRGLLLRFLGQFVQFFSLILWTAAALSFLAEWITPGQGMAKIGVAIVVVIVVSGVFAFWQEHRVEQTLVALRKLLPQLVKVLRDGKAVQIASERVVPGDIVLLEQGDNVPADCRLVEAFDVRVNNAAVTGESLPKLRETDPSDETELVHSKNVLLAGTSVVSGQAKAVVFATGMRTEFGKIAHLTQTAREATSPLTKQLAHLTRLIAILSIVIGGLFFLVGRWVGVSFWQDFLFAIGILVAMVPEGLLPTLTLALVLATQRMAKRSVLVRYLPSVETLGSTTVICTDKTGTLTQNRMTVKQLFLGRAIDWSTMSEQREKLATLHRPFFMTARLCHDLKESRERGVFLGDPMEVALVEMAEQALPALPTYERLDELPFDADRMRLSTIYAMPEGPTLYCKGALESVLPLCNRIQVDDGIRPLDPQLREAHRSAQERMAEQGLRVLAFAYRPVGSDGKREQLEQDLIFTGFVGLEDPPRPEVPEAIHKCRQAGIKVIMITGDHPRTATAIARQIGLAESDNPVVITGEALRHLSAVELMLALDAPELIFARVVADQK